MTAFPAKPAESLIEESVDPAGVTLSWRPQPVRPDLRLAAFLAVWLCGWLVSLVYAVVHFVNGESRVFLMVWLGVWIIAGAVVWRSIWARLRPLPESIRIEAEIIQYDSGCRIQSRNQRILEFLRSDFHGFVLERTEGRHRLSLDLGGDGLLEIGSSLREPDRMWIFAVLETWYFAGPEAP